MKAIFYENTKTTIPHFIDELHISHPLGYAYETSSHFVHLYGQKGPLYIISFNLTVVEAKNGLTLDQWVNKTFGAKNIKVMDIPVGQVLKGVWRPGLYFYDDIKQALKYDENLLLQSKQSLIILLQKLNELLLYIQPTKESLKTYGHKIRELLLLSATEFENQCTLLLKEWGINPTGRYYTTNDYIKIKKHVKLTEFTISYKVFEKDERFVPFEKWSKTNPTKTLEWYDSYNKTKHNQYSEFDKATLNAVFNSIAANIIMFITRFSPFLLIHGNDLLSSYTNQLLEIKIEKANPRNFYIPLIKIPTDTMNDLFIYSAHDLNWVQNWNYAKRDYK